MSMPMTRASSATRRAVLSTIRWKANTTIGRLGIVWACIFAIFGSSRSTRLDRPPSPILRSEEHTSELQSQSNLVCRLLLEKKNIEHKHIIYCLAAMHEEVGLRL